MSSFKFSSDLNEAVNKIIKEFFKCSPEELLGRRIKATCVNFDGVKHDDSEAILFYGTIDSVVAQCDASTDHDLWVMVIPTSSSPDNVCAMGEDTGNLYTTCFSLHKNKGGDLEVRWEAGSVYYTDIDLELL